ERLHRLVEDLLVLSRVERGRLDVEAEPIEPRRLLERIVAHEARELPSITVQTDLEPDLPIVAGESTYVEQIVRNLLNNAAKYTPFGSHIVVSARKAGDTIEVRVTDDGPGIPTASIERIFELFYRDPSSSRLVAGSGIGLFVCSSLVEAMGGRIWAARPSSGGTEIGFTLRILEPDRDDEEEPGFPTRRSRGEAAPREPASREAAESVEPPELEGNLRPLKPAPALSEGSTPPG
ncbi:MAG TPA: ATP-binding protein, partial [Candidatus Limnocylindrales bacterium]|nr:ATP-binding protein [Candidatus Limnocylindrales bacterium]